MPDVLHFALDPIPLYCFTDGRPRRCGDPVCGGVAFLGPPARYKPRGRYLCATCGRDAHRNGQRPCPRCGGLAHVDDASNELRCLAGCEALALPWKDEPTTWETAVRQDEIDGRNRYDRYSGPSELERRFGHDDHRGRRLAGADDFAIDAAHAVDLKRIDEMTKALDAYGVAVRSDPSVRGHGPSWFRDFGRVVCEVLCNAILARGGSYKGFTDASDVRPSRSTPYAGYNHALGYAFGDPSYARDADHRSPLASSMGRISDNFYTTSLPQGLQFDLMAVNPSRGGAGQQHDSRYIGEDSVVSCLRAARVGGTWTPVSYRADSTVDQAAVCAGGRPLTGTELELLRLCDVGVAVESRGKARFGQTFGPAAEEFRRLTISEAMSRIRRDREAHPEARHMLETEAKALLKGARQAVREALVAWRSIPPDEPRKPRQDGKEREGGPTGAVAAFAPTLSFAGEV